MATQNINQEDAIYIIIGDTIRHLRRQANMTQQELAEHLGLMRTSITNMEAGRQHFQVHTLCAIAAFFNVPVSALFKEVSLTPEGQGQGAINIQLQLEIIRQREQLAKIRSIVLQQEETDQSQPTN